MKNAGENAECWGTQQKSQNESEEAGYRMSGKIQKLGENAEVRGNPRKEDEPMKRRKKQTRELGMNIEVRGNPMEEEHRTQRMRGPRSSIPTGRIGRT